jgi:Fe-S-cluster-containing dehydrogenase component
MESSRRRFIKMAGIAALGLGATPAVIKAVAATSEQGAKQFLIEKSGNQLRAKQWAMVIDTRRFNTVEDMQPLIEACDRAHNIPHMPNKKHEIKWIWDTHYDNAFPENPNQFLDEAVEQRPYLVLCNHCQNPPCVRACPTQATFKRASDGIVMMDYHRCIGCRFCMAACPFGSRSFNFRDPRPFIKDLNPQYPTRTKGVVEKCNFCQERLAIGKMPACVEASKGALVFGDLMDPQSEVRRLLRGNFTIRRKQNLGTEPCVYYIV